MLTGIAVLGQDPRDTLAAASLPARRRRSTPRRRNTTPVSPIRRVRKNTHVGVSRRLRALAWMGHGPTEIAGLIGETPDEVDRWMHGAPVAPHVVDVVDRVFESPLCMRFGPDGHYAALARAEGWAPPLAWLHLDIDSPHARPHVDIPSNARRNAHPLESQVLLALAGRQTVHDLVPAEKIRVVSILHYAGWSDRRIAAYLRWNPDNNIDLGRAACEKFRRDRHITGGGLDLVQWGGNRDDANFITIPAAA